MPYIQRKKDELNLPNSQRALCITDGFRAQCTSNVVKLLDHHGIDTQLTVPGVTAVGFKFE